MSEALDPVAAAHVEALVAIMEALPCPSTFDAERWAQAKQVKARIWRREVSASMSCIEYLDPEAAWIAREVARVVAEGGAHRKGADPTPD